MVAGPAPYVEAFTELTRASRERARARARTLLAAAGLEDAAAGAGERAGRLAEEILQASRANRVLVQHLIGEEVTRAADRWGFVRTEELEDLRRELDELRVALVKAHLGTAAVPRQGSRRSPARRLTRVRGRTFGTRHGSAA